MRWLSLLLIWMFYAVNAQGTPFGPEPEPRLLHERWDANWITYPGTPGTVYGVYHFRKPFEMEQLPDRFVVNVSADNRYILYINGQLVARGPARGDREHWYYETIDIGAHLRPGKNVLAAVVWNFGEWMPNAQISLSTGFILQGNRADEALVNTDSTWRVYKNDSYKPSVAYNYEVGCTDVVQAGQYPWGWETIGYDDSAWIPASGLGRGQPYGSQTGYRHVLAPRDIPMMQESEQRLQRVRRSVGLDVPHGFLHGKQSITIMPHSKVSILLDQDVLTTAYPELSLSSGEGSAVQMTYAEALVDQTRRKGNRDEIEGKHIYGYSDWFYPDGGDRTFRPLWFRTYRYLQLDIETKDEPLVIHDISAMFTGYPFRENGSFSSNDEQLRRIWEVGWRTARLCAQETYVDCPYYEQLQYVGDTRIQALISLYVSGDDRLMRKAIRLFNWSSNYEGITASRYPTRINQYIPPFSLYWINMVHDYWMHRPDSVFVKEQLRAVDDVLYWFSSRIDPSTGLLGPLPHWNFVDWAEPWPWDINFPTGGVPPGGNTGGSAILTLQFAYALKDAIRLFHAFGNSGPAIHYQTLHDSLVAGVQRHCWDGTKGIFTDDIRGTSASQHVQILAILCGAVPKDQDQALFDRILSDPGLIQSTFYYRYYLFRAMKKAGRAEQFTNLLGPWYNMLELGLTTFAERPEPTRSDCHAWSASPVYELLATVCGVEPDEPGFRSVRVQPHFGHLIRIKGSVPHPKGVVEVELTREENSVTGYVRLPEGVKGRFIYKGQERLLVPGNNQLTL